MMRPIGTIRRFAVVAGMATALGTVAAPAAVALTPAVHRARHAVSVRGRVSCRQGRHLRRLSVALTPGQPATEKVAAEYCSTQAERRSGGTVQLLVPGATYNHTYWDFGTFGGERYSYARDVADAGIPTFAIDELGTGGSSHPASALLTVATDAYVVHQVIAALRDGTATGTAFAKVILVGHSLGSVVAWQEAISYHDAAGLIATGAAHVSNLELVQSLYPAIDDPKFADSGLDPGYLTTRSGTRSVLFYAVGDSAPAVRAADEARKDVTSSAIHAGFAALTTTAATRSIRVPVLEVLGSRDALFCGANLAGPPMRCSSGASIVAYEAPYFSRAANLHACAVPGSGHSINLARDHRLEERDAVTWSYDHVGQAHVGRRHVALSGHCS